MDVNMNEVNKNTKLQVGDLVKLSSGVCLVVDCCGGVGERKYGLKYLSGAGYANGFYDVLDELLDTNAMKSLDTTIYSKNDYKLQLVKK